MDARDVAALLELLGERPLRAWVAGGWGADALGGKQTRMHSDVDLAVDAEQLPEVIDVLTGLGYGITTDWLPSRVELTDRENRRIDLHPVHFRPTEAVGSQGVPIRPSSTGRTVSPPAVSTVVPCRAFLVLSNSAFAPAMTGGPWITMTCL